MSTTPLAAPLPQGETGRLRFGLWSADNRHDARELWGDIAVTQYIGGPFSDDDIERKREREEQCWHCSGVQYWPMYLRTTGEFVGCCGLRPYQDQEQQQQKSSNDGNSSSSSSNSNNSSSSSSSSSSSNEEVTTYEIGFHIVPRCWGAGLACEAARHVIAHAFASAADSDSELGTGLGAGRVFAGHNPNNRASAALLVHKLGFTYSHNEFYAPTGLMHPSYFLLRPIVTDIVIPVLCLQEK
jgi:[ribosomal protein S5]-alanine N-acetyltransferase